MNGGVQHIARRGLELATRSISNNRDKAEFSLELPPWGIAVFVFTAFAFIIGMSTIEYTFGRLVPTLIMVESQEAILFEPLPSDDHDATLKKEPELLLVKQQPITSSFRTTIKHLQSKAGFRSRYRGICLYAVYAIGLAWTAQILSILLFIPRGAAAVLAIVLFANVQMTWTHIVISEPSAKPWFKRMPSAKLFKKIAGPTAVLAIMEQLSQAVPKALAEFYGFGTTFHGDISKMTGAEKNLLILKGLSVVGLAIIMAVFLVLPANVMLTRVQASLLAETEETIVPFDRSFGGKVVPEIVGGSGVVSMRDAWKSFDCNARVRLFKAYVKVFAMEFALSFIFFFVIAAEAFIIIGESNLKKMIPSEPEVVSPGDEMFNIL